MKMGEKKSKHVDKMEDDMKLTKFSKGKLLKIFIINYFRFKILGYYWVFCPLIGK